MSHSRKRRGRRRPNPITLRHRFGCTIFTDARIPGRVIIPGLWKTVAEVRTAIDRLPAKLIKDKYYVKVPS